MEERILEYHAAEFRRGQDVTTDATAELFDAIVASTSTSPLLRLLQAWNDKGFTESELYSFASLMRQRMIRVESRCSPLVDIVGTGAAAAKTFNVSTAAAFIVAGSGTAVAKHGNKAATSRAGSADVLADLRVVIDSSPELLERRLDRDGICFLFAPNHHSLSPTLAAARRELGQPTIFNCLGPLCNPASPNYSLLGVSRADWVIPMAGAAARLGTSRTWVVHGTCGLDELAVTSPTTVAEVKDGSVQMFEVCPADFGITGQDEGLPPACNAAESAEIVESILSGTSTSTPIEHLALINAAAAIYVANAAPSLPAAYQSARESISNGSAAAKLNALRRRI